MVPCVDRQACCSFHGMVQCSEQMLHMAVTLHSNFLHLVTSCGTALITYRSNTTVLCYCVMLHVCSQL